MNFYGLIILVVLSAILISCESERKVEVAPEKIVSDYPKVEIPSVLHNLKYDESGRLYQQSGNDSLKRYLQIPDPVYTLDKFEIDPVGSDSGITFDFDDIYFDGKLYYGFILSDREYPYPVYFKRYAKIIGGICKINIKKNLSGKYDLPGWQEKGKAKIGYRIVNEQGQIIYDGKRNITYQDSFRVDTSIIEGPFLNKLTHNSAVISFKTNVKCKTSIEVDDRMINDSELRMDHEIMIDGLKAAAMYNYKVNYGGNSDRAEFTTAPKPGSRSKFSFAFASDSRSGRGGGERDIYGANAYIMKKIAALCTQQDAAFLQFTGDLIDGYLTSMSGTLLQYTNWKRSIEPFAAWIPVNLAMGNHESLNYKFGNSKGNGLSVDKFPYDTASGETAFAKAVVNPLNGPESEDGSKYDPNPNRRDFPSYKENVFYYVYDNAAMISLNSNYWYSPSRRQIPKIGGGLHGYIMDNQLNWLEETIKKLEEDKNIDHVFVTLHTPAFPNGGHSDDDMWYAGDNSYRPYIAGKAVDKGIIERRDEFLDLLINNSSKVVAILAGDEHNYSRMKITRDTKIYPDDWQRERIEISRPIWHITNGSAGAPYYGQEILPWTPWVEKFSTQYAVCFLEIDGREVILKVIDPDTLEEIELVKLK